jgi:ATP-dependent helicase/nuclease subunit A
MQISDAKQLIEAQANAAHTLDQHVSVTAGPGSGKTTVLVERYLHILKTGQATIDQIVAITFTNRAANEMRERLRRELDSLIIQSPPVERSRWTEHKRKLDGAIITTIHGFCAGLLREFPIEARLDPEFLLLEDHQAVMLEESVVRAMVTEWIASGDETVSKLAAGIGRVKLASTLAAIYRTMRSQALSARQVVARTIEHHRSQADYDLALERLDDAIARVLNTRGLSPAAEAKRQALQQEWPRLSAKLRLGPAGFEVAEFCRDVDNFREATRPDARGPIKPLVHEVDGLIWGKDLGCLIPRIWLDFHARDYAARLGEMAGSLEVRLREEKLRLAALDFEDLQLRALELLQDHPDVLEKAAARCRYILIDEFQDTNGLQRDLIKQLTLSRSSGTNVFIVGDSKQSIYGFRGADVRVFHEMTRTLEAAGGSAKPLHLNFRSQAPLVNCFNQIFSYVFARPLERTQEELEELGYVEHEPSVAERGQRDGPNLVELLIDTGPGPKTDGDEGSGGSSRDRDAIQVAARCESLVSEHGGEGPGPSQKARFRYSDIALLFRAMTQAYAYESVFRRQGIPYQTIQGRGFYDRREIVDLIQLLRFLDNRTDDIALAAILRSPLCGLSDSALLAVSGAGFLQRDASGKGPRRREVTLWSCLLSQRQNDIVPAEERGALERAVELLKSLAAVRHAYKISDMLRLASDLTEYRAVISASFDGPQRLANVDKLFSLAERFERSGAYNIRDFVRFVGDFENSSAREGEGRIDESEDAVRMMTVHQAKGLQFPVVIIPELHRRRQEQTDWFVLDRHRGLSVKVPDGRAGLAEGFSMKALRDRARVRERFESSRLLYVAATRAQDRLILAGSEQNLEKLSGDSETWLAWIWQALKLQKEHLKTAIVEIDEKVHVRVEINLADGHSFGDRMARRTIHAAAQIDFSRPAADLFPLLSELQAAPAPSTVVSVTQLATYSRCPRQYYLDRVLHAPRTAEIEAWDEVEGPEPPSNLTAVVKGLTIHLFCERFKEGMDSDACLRSSLDQVVRKMEISGGVSGRKVNVQAAMAELGPLVRNYLASSVRARIDAAARQQARVAKGSGVDAVLSEQSFALRRAQATVWGTIDKVVLRAAKSGGNGIEAEIIDFKTNRFKKDTHRNQAGGPVESNAESQPGGSNSLEDEAALLASGYTLQMQAYSLAVRNLLPKVTEVKATLHFLDPNVEYSLPAQLMERQACADAVDAVITPVTSALVSSSNADEFPARTAGHCRACIFLGICQPGLEWIKARRRETLKTVPSL